MSEFIADQWRSRFAENGLVDFEAIWNLDIGWFEEPNRRRGGWSGVSRMDIRTGNGTAGIFIKRQEDHIYRSARHPFGELTFVREYHNNLAYHRAGVPALDVIYFATRDVQGHRRAILITRELEGFLPMDSFLQQSATTPLMRRQLAPVIADAVRKMHVSRLQHNCLYSKHVFVNASAGTVEARVIDLEKTKRRWSRKQAMLRDLDTLNRHSLVNTTDRLRFLLAYMQKSAVDSSVRELWNRLNHLAANKHR